MLKSLFWTLVPTLGSGLLVKVGNGSSFGFLHWLYVEIVFSTLLQSRGSVLHRLIPYHRLLFTTHSAVYLIILWYQTRDPPRLDPPRLPICAGRLGPRGESIGGPSRGSLGMRGRLPSEERRGSSLTPFASAFFSSPPRGTCAQCSTIGLSRGSLETSG